MNLKAPIIIIGAGRSGTSLLNYMLTAHQDIVMLGETEFMIPKLWRIFWEITASEHEISRRTKLSIDNFIASSGRPADEVLISLSSAHEESERLRVGNIILSAIDRMFGLSDRSPSLWGFKEPWIGTDENFQDWECYDYVLPEAIWLHITRNPFAFARSCADWHRKPFTTHFLYDRLDEWAKCAMMNRQRHDTGRYISVRYEDLVAEPLKTLAPLFERLGIAFGEDCIGAMKNKYVASVKRSPFPPFNRDEIMSIPKFGELLSLYSYDMPESSAPSPNEPVASCIAADLHTPAAILSDDGAWLLNPPFALESNFCWHVDFQDIPGLSRLEAMADNLREPYRSELSLFEDGKLLGPSHTLHDKIRMKGMGVYSHWTKIGLLFSTSDNSDPNTNGRTYSIRFSR